MLTDTPISLSLAPLRGVTTVTFRRVFARHFSGVDQALSPFIPTVSGQRVKDRTLRDVLPGSDQAPFRLVPQMIGNRPDDMVTLANALADLGYDEVNWNLGCPWPMVRKKKRGSGLLPHPELVCSILDSVMPRISVAFSIKVRLGVECSDDVLRLLPRLDDYPLSEVIIHPRTAVQMYEGQADPDAFADCLPLTRHPVVYNGDLWHEADYRRLATRFPGIDRWMCGRGLVRRPMLGEEIKGDGPECAPAERVRVFHDDLYEGYRDILFGPSPLLGKMKEFWFYLSGSFEHGGRLLKRIQRTQQTGAYEDLVAGFFASSPRWLDS